MVYQRWRCCPLDLLELFWDFVATLWLNSQSQSFKACYLLFKARAVLLASWLAWPPEPGGQSMERSRRTLSHALSNSCLVASLGLTSQNNNDTALKINEGCILKPYICKAKAIPLTLLDNTFGIILTLKGRRKKTWQLNWIIYNNKKGHCLLASTF